jgi:hypothetical protein
MYIKVIDDTYTKVTRPHDPEDQWSGEDTYTSHSIEGIEIVKKNEYYDLETEFKILPNKDYYLLYAIYSTGDSFSHHEGKIDYIYLYKTASKAEAAKTILENHDTESKDWDERFNKTIKTEKGKNLKLYISWAGYFESLTSVNIEMVRIISHH